MNEEREEPVEFEDLDGLTFKPRNGCDGTNWDEDKGEDNED